MMNTVMTIIFVLGLACDAFMVTPFGMGWVIDDMESHKTVHGVWLALIATMLMLISGAYLGILD